MRFADLVLPLLIAAAAVIYGAFAGQARASRLRELHQDISTGNLRGYLVIFFVIVMILASFVF